MSYNFFVPEETLTLVKSEKLKALSQFIRELGKRRSTENSPERHRTLSPLLRLKPRCGITSRCSQLGSIDLGSSGGIIGRQALLLAAAPIRYASIDMPSLHPKFGTTRTIANCDRPTQGRKAPRHDCQGPFVIGTPTETPCQFLHHTAPPIPINEFTLEQWDSSDLLVRHENQSAYGPYCLMVPMIHRST